MNKSKLQEVIKLHTLWLIGNKEGKRADLSGANLHNANLSGANLHNANLHNANLRNANLSGANLSGANLSGANLQDANLHNANLHNANLSGANLHNANLQDAIGLLKLMGVVPGNIYYKRLNEHFCNKGYQYTAGVNKLRPQEVFASDERVLCSYPGFHFASKSWCATNYPNLPYEAKIRIPLDAEINEPWATDGKASADKIEILQVIDVRTGEDVTDQLPQE